jgi:hypothetical protein
MDWINQNKWKSILIGALLLLNGVTIMIIWMQPLRNPAETPTNVIRQAPESANVMKSALNLTDEQAAEFTRMLTDYHAQAQSYNDHLAALKRGLAAELFKSAGDDSVAIATAKEIGETQSKIEVLRFQHFQRFLAICSCDQKEKLQPILMELFGRRPPREEPKVGAHQERSREQTHVNDNSGAGVSQSAGPPTRPEQEPPGPPTVDEKLSKYASRLTLSIEQQHKVRVVLEDSRKKGEELRGKTNPEPREIDAEKDRIRAQEDEKIREILNEEQKKTFEDMVVKRSQDRH